MKAERNTYGDWVVTEGKERYTETENAQPTSRLLEGSDDQGYAAEYVGYGTIDNVPVKAIYLLDDEQYDCEDEGDINWDYCLECGRIIVDADELTEQQWAELQKAGELKK